MIHFQIQTLHWDKMKMDLKNNYTSSEMAVLPRGSLFGKSYHPMPEVAGKCSIFAANR